MLLTIMLHFHILIFSSFFFEGILKKGMDSDKELLDRTMKASCETNFKYIFSSDMLSTVQYLMYQTVLLFQEVLLSNLQIFDYYRIPNLCATYS